MATPRKSLSELARMSTQHTPAPEPTPEAPTSSELSAAIRSRLNSTKTTRPLKPKKACIELEPEFYDAVAIKARQEGMTLADLTRQLYRIYLDS